MDQVKEWLPFMSLAVALLAVCFSPLISWLVAKKQINSTLKVANKQILAPMRQQWIEALRDLISELTSEAHYLYIAGGDEETDATGKTDKARHRMLFLEQKIRLMVNPKEDDHQVLVQRIRDLVTEAESSGRPRKDFGALHQEVTDLSRRVFKREWDRIKEPF